MSDSFSEKQAHILSHIQQCRGLLESVHRAHISGKYVLLYPRLGQSWADGKNGKSQSSTKGLKGADFKLLAISEEILAHEDEVEESSLARLMGAKIGDCIAYLERLRLRVGDRTSKILVTGDVNSGKSTFVNALLRKDLLPTDQQPCTQCFCEVVPDDFTISGRDEKTCVHAIADYELYNPQKPDTFSILGISEMQESIQDESTKYQMFRVFLQENESSLLHGTGMNLSLIDSPGLNSDLFKTLSLFSKQEDIDVIVFLINAANHLTLSAREFLEKASQEKAYMFIVVNKFDDIKNREKCKRVVLSQIQEVLPKTYEDRSELIHFVSAGRFLKDCSVDADKSPKSASSIETRTIMGSDDLGVKDHIDFIELEDCLGKFIFEKRIKSKLLPAQTYLQRLLNEILGIIEYNKRRISEELCRVKHELEIISPCFDELMAHNGLLQADLRRTVDEVTRNVYDHAKATLTQSASTVVVVQATIPWRGVFNVLQFTQNVHRAIVIEWARLIDNTRSEAVSHTVTGINLLHSVASNHARRLFPSSNDFDEERVISMFPATSSLAIPIKAMSTWEVLDTSSFMRGSTWLSAATLAGAAFGYQPLLSLALRILDLSRRASRVVTLCMLAAAGGFALVTLLGDMESIVRTRLQQYYSESFVSNLWVHEPSRALESATHKVLGEYQGSFVNRFENALHQQRQLRAEKDLQRCQTETLLTYLDDQFKSTQHLLASIRQYQL